VDEEALFKINSSREWDLLFSGEGKYKGPDCPQPARLRHRRREKKSLKPSFMGYAF